MYFFEEISKNNGGGKGGTGGNGGGYFKEKAGGSYPLTKEIGVVKTSTKKWRAPVRSRGLLVARP